MYILTVLDGVHVVHRAAYGSQQGNFRRDPHWFRITHELSSGGRKQLNFGTGAMVLFLRAKKRAVVLLSFGKFNNIQSL